jgi:carbon-monoxide dehydrogenase medium subunit
VVTVAVTLTAGTGGQIGEARVAFGGVAGTAVRAPSAEAALAGQTPSAELWKAAGQEAAAGLDPPGDLHSTPEHRRHLAAVLTERALAEAYDRLGKEA